MFRLDGAGGGDHRTALGAAISLTVGRGPTTWMAAPTTTCTAGETLKDCESS